MNRQWRQVLPPVYITAAFFVIYLLTYLLFDLYIIRWGIAVPDEIKRTRILMLGIASGLYGLYRVWLFHPCCNAKYWQWLCLSPWSIDKPLPQGPVHLIWVDVVILGVLTLLAYSNMPFLAIVPIVAFLGAYIAMAFLALQGDQIVIITLVLFITPFVIYPLRNLYFAAGVLVLLYGFCYVGFYRSFRNFPWNSQYWKGDIVEEFKKQAVRQNVLGWPFKFLNVFDAIGISFWGAFILSLLLTWWLHVIRWCFDKPYNMSLIMLLAVFMALFRMAVYTCNYRPPISLMGRIFTGRLIIPRYDKVYTAPICILLTGIPLLLFLYLSGFGIVWSCELCFFLVFLLAFGMPPKLKKWRLTGAYRFGGGAQSLRVKVPSRQDQELAELIIGKLRSPS
ncbi:MAG: hypothetical protein JW936_08740 [Sedimentisphaerales bacterium]|nr:hypothetical protein [Sedimentisphaerales bacterium]